LDKGSDAILELDLRRDIDPKTGQPVTNPAPARATYNLNYFGEIIRAGSGASEVTSLEFSTNMPIKVEFEMPQQGRLLYYLAPRIEQE
jgi:proliferating cell nuclear antigen